MRSNSTKEWIRKETSPLPLSENQRSVSHAANTCQTQASKLLLIRICVLSISYRFRLPLPLRWNDFYFLIGKHKMFLHNFLVFRCKVIKLLLLPRRL